MGTHVMRRRSRLHSVRSLAVAPASARPPPQRSPLLARHRRSRSRRPPSARTRSPRSSRRSSRAGCRPVRASRRSSGRSPTTSARAHAMAVNSCTAALHLSLLAAGVGAGDEVITTPLTFCATANVIVHAGATPVFADIDPVTCNLDPRGGRTRRSPPRTRAILPVHYAGRPADMTALRSAGRAPRGLTLIEDAAHCVEGVADGPQGRLDRRLHLLQLLRDQEPDDRRRRHGDDAPTPARRAFMRTASLHGMSRDAWTRYAPGGSAALRRRDARLQIQHDGPAGRDRPAPARAASTRMHARREAIWARYDEALAGLPLRRPAPVARRHRARAPSLYGARRRAGRRRVARRAAATAARRAASRPAFTSARCTCTPTTRSGSGFGRGMFPVAETVSDTTLSLPLSPAHAPTRRSIASSRRFMTRFAKLRAPLRVLFRAAAGPRRGFGHLVRCRSLARALGVRPLVCAAWQRHAADDRALALGCDVVLGSAGSASRVSRTTCSSSTIRWPPRRAAGSRGATSSASSSRASTTSVSAASPTPICASTAA